MVRQASLILLVLTIAAFWLQITWLYIALGLLFVAVLAAEAMGSSAATPTGLVRAEAHAPASPREIVVVQQPTPHSGMGVMDVLFGTLMAQSVISRQMGPQPPFHAIDSRLAAIEKKLEQPKGDKTD